MKDLVKIIKENPGCIAVIDNDSWHIQKQPSENCPSDVDEDQWHEDNILVSNFL